MTTFERLHAEDRLFLDVEDSLNNMHIAGCFTFDAAPLTLESGGLDIDRITDYIESRLYRIPRYRQRLEFTPIEGHPVWVDDASFNIRYHVRHTWLPQPGDERELKRLCGRLVSQQLDRKKPLWELYVVGGISGNRCALITKVHHCLADGISGVDLLQNLLSSKPLEEFDAPPRWLPQPVPEPDELLRDAISLRLTAPLRAGGALLDALRHPGEAIENVRDAIDSLRDVIEVDANPASETPLNQRLGPHRRYDWVSFDHAEMNRVRKVLGGTLNDLVLAIVAGAVGRFFERRGITRNEQRDIDFRIACPQSLRPRSERNTYGNQVGMFFVDVPIHERDPQRMVDQVREAAGAAKTSKQSKLMETISTIGDWTTPMLLTLFVRLSVNQRPANMVVTNVPGPRKPLYLLGARMLETYPVVPLMQDSALGIALFTYDGRVHWGINSDWDCVPDLHDFVEALEATYAELREAAGEEPLPEPMERAVGADHDPGA